MDDAPSKGRSMEYFILAGFLAAWVVVQVWVLPRVGMRS